VSEKDHKDLLKPIYSSVERMAPTNRELIDFVNSKARGEGLQRSIYKVKFIDKSERSAKQIAGITLMEFGKHLKEQNLSEAEETALLKEAAEILEDAKKQVEKVYGEVRRYVVTSELRTGCLQANFRKIPNLSEEQNRIISKEIFSLALEEINKGGKSSIDEIETEFQKINHIAMTLFDVAANSEKTSHKEKKHHTEKKSASTSIWDRFF